MRQLAIAITLLFNVFAVAENTVSGEASTWSIFSPTRAGICSASEAQNCSGDCAKTSGAKSLQKIKQAEVIAQGRPGLRELNYLKDKVEKLREQVHFQKKHWAATFRILRDTPDKAKLDSNYLKLRTDYDILAQIVTEIHVNQEKLNFCITRCSASWKLDLNTNIEKLQKAKIALLVAQPFLASEAVEKSLTQKQSLSPDAVDKVLIGSLSEQLVLMDKRELLYEKFLNDPEGPYRPEDPKREEYIRSYLDGVSSRHFEVLGDVHRVFEPGEVSDPEAQVFCDFDAQYAKAVRTKKYLAVGEEAALFSLPWLLGPLGRPLLGIKNLSRVLQFGLRTGEGLVLGATNLAAIASMQQKCDRLQTQHLMSPSEVEYAGLVECRDEVVNQEIMVAIGAGLVVKTLAVRSSQALLGGIDGPKVPIYTETSSAFYSQLKQRGLATVKKPEGFYVTDLDLSKLTGRSNTSELATQYFQHVGEVYKSRLNLTGKEVDSFVKSSVEMMDRTKLVFITKQNPSLLDPDFLGGIGLVKSRGAHELLPLEKATGILVDRSQGNVAEVVRLTVTSQDNKGLCRDLVDEVKKIIAADPSIKKVYIYTSKIHSRLYRSMGLPVKIEKVINDRDVLMSTVP